MKRVYLLIFVMAYALIVNLAIADSYFDDNNAFVVKDVRVEGLEKISVDAVLQELPIKVGQEVTKTEVTDTVRRLFKTGFFEVITLAKEQNTLVINLKERPAISKLEIKGIKDQVAINKILKDHAVEAGKFYEPVKLAQVEQEIERHYLVKGRYGVKVNSIVEVKDKNRVAITLDIYEGTEAKIKGIDIVGNTVFSTKKLREEFLHTTTNWKSWLTKSDRYAKEKLAADLEKLRSYYMDRGYVNFQVESTQVSLSPDKKDVYITINVSEGEQYKFADPIKLSGKFVVAEEKLQALIDETIKPGGVFSRVAIWEVKEKLESALGEEGYSQAQARLNIENDDQNKLMKLEFFIDPSKRVTVRRIEIVGNTLSQDVVLRRGIEQMEGSWISTKKIREGKEYMQREGLAGQVEVTNKPVLGKDDQVDVCYKVEEQRTAQFSASVAYSKADSFMYSLAADFKNFLGTGKNTNVAFEQSKTTTSYNFGYYDPYYTSDGVGMGYNLNYQKVNFSKTSSISEYATDTMGGNVNWSYPLSLYDRVSFGLGAESIKLKINEDPNSTPREMMSFIRNEGKNFKEYTTSVSWNRNTCDTYIFPTNGIMQQASLRFSLPFSKMNYYQLEYLVNWYRPLAKGYVIQLSSNFGYEANYKSKSYFPFYKHYFAGGTDSVRGFEERSLGPMDSAGNPFGGNILAVAKAAFIFPPPFVSDAKSLRTALFLDAGQVYDTNYKNKRELVDQGSGKSFRNPKGLRYSVGMSLTWNSPLGMPLVFSLSKPLKKRPNDRLESFAFSFGTSFM